MDNLDEYIAKKIEDGSYYHEARQWYMRKYIYPISERSFLIILTIILFSTFTASVINTSSLSSSDKELPLPIEVENTTDYYSVIKPLASSNEGAQDAIAKYFIIDYIRTREEYFPEKMQGKDLQYQLKKIKSSSAKKVLNEYQAYMNNANPYSPIARYRNHTTRNIEITSFKFANNDPSSGKATAGFMATTGKKDDPSVKENKTLWEATIHFRLSDVETIAYNEAPLRFLVKYYRAKIVK